VIQEERSIYWEVIVSVMVRRKVRLNMCLILNGYRDRAVTFESVRFLFVGLDEERSLQKMGGYTRQIARSHFLCCLTYFSHHFPQI
jgi:hypothetical protein